MRRTGLSTIAAIAFAIATPEAAAERFPGAGDMRAPAARSGPVAFGVYDPHGQYENSFLPDIEHVFVYWQALDTQMLDEKMRLAEARGRALMVTVEPYTEAANWRDGGDRLLGDVARGEYDDRIAAVCGAVSGFSGDLWLRWGHEMEEPSERYPWAGRAAEAYVSAYRHFVETCERIVPRARFVWSPKGEPGLSAYYPGNAHVDMVGVAVWGLEAWDRERYGRPRGFSETFREKYRRVQGFGKPVIIAEFGVAGCERYRESWIADLVGSSAKGGSFPQLTGVVYFNDKEPYHWPMGFGSPDWRASQALLETAARRLSPQVAARRSGPN